MHLRLRYFLCGVVGLLVTSQPLPLARGAEEDPYEALYDVIMTRHTLSYFARTKKQPEMIPVGTQFALIEQALLISSKGELILSPLIISVQLRAYLDVTRSAREAHPQPTQCVAEFLMQPRELMKGNAILKAVTPTDHRYEAGGADQRRFTLNDPFESSMPELTRLNLCVRCHGGKPGVLTKDLYSTLFPFKPTDPDPISKATVKRKLRHITWQKLQEFWRAEAAE